MKTLPLTLPSGHYEFLLRKAVRQHTTVEEIIRAQIERLILRERDMVYENIHDPFYRKTSLQKSGLDDFGLNHDHYLYGVDRR